MAIYLFFSPNHASYHEKLYAAVIGSQGYRFHLKSCLTVDTLLFGLLCITYCGIFLQGHVTAMSQTDSETLQDVMIVMTAVEIASVEEIALMTRVAETMIVEVCSVSSIFPLIHTNHCLIFSHDTRIECK